jgi:RND superfamily putative drug exporter
LRTAPGLVLCMWLVVLPGTDSQRATDTLARSSRDQANGTSPIVLHAASGKLTDSKYAAAVDQAVADVAKAPHVAAVVNPLTRQGAAALSKDKATGYVSVTLAVSPGELPVEEAQTTIDAANPAKAAGLQRRPAPEHRGSGVLQGRRRPARDAR